MFYQRVIIDNYICVPCPYDQSSAQSENNSACTTGMALSNFRIINDEFLNKDPYVVPEKVPLLILDSK